MSDGVLEEAFWLEQVRAWRSSGLRRGDFCRSRELDLGQFHHWVGRLRGRFRRPVKDALGDTETGAFIPVVVEEATAPEPPPERLSASSLEIVVGSMTVRVAGPVDAAALREVLSVVRSVA